MKKTWIQKIADKPQFPKVLPLETEFPCFRALQAMGVKVGEPVVLVNASEVIPLMAAVPSERVITVREICRSMARKHKVAGCCSLVTGIEIMCIANAVEEIRATGTPSELLSIPYWRTLKAEGFLNEKYPGGQEAQKARLEQEGFRIRARGKRYQVIDYERYLIQV